MNTKIVQIYYDGGCPFCARYVRYLNLQKSLGAPELINVRENRAAYDYLRGLGYDINQGMVARMDDDYFSGARAMTVLALMSTKSGIFNRLMRSLFSIKWLTALLYPVLAAGRRMTLFALRVPKINHH